MSAAKVVAGEALHRMVDGGGSSPWVRPAPTRETQALPSLGDRTTDKAERPNSGSVWGAAPVGVPRGTGGQLRAVAPTPVGQLSNSPRLFGPTELLRLRDKDRVNQVRAIEEAGWPGPRTVLIGSLYGGTGVSTLAAQVGWAGRERGLPVVLLDASEAYSSGAVARVPEAARMSQQPSWADLAQLSARGAAAVSAAFGERLPGLAGAVPVLIGGRQPTDGLRHRPPAGLLQAAAHGAQAGGWPLVVIDHGAGADALTATLARFDPDLLVLTTRGDAAEIRESAAYLRGLAGGGVWSSDRTVIAVVHGDKIDRPVAAARASVLDAAAGSIDARWSDALRDRTRPVAGVPPAVSLLLSALAITTSHQPKPPLTGGLQ